MMNLIKSFWNNEDGLGTVEIVLIIAILVGLALIFRDAILKFVNEIILKITGTKDSWDPTGMNL